MSADGFPVSVSSRERSVFAIRFAILGRHKLSCNVLFAIASREHPLLIRHLGNASSQVRVTKIGTTPKIRSSRVRSFIRGRFINIRDLAKSTRQVALMHGSHLKSFRQSRQRQFSDAPMLHGKEKGTMTLSSSVGCVACPRSC